MRDVALSLSYGSKKEGQEGREAQSRSKAQSRKEDGRKEDVEEALTRFHIFHILRTHVVGECFF